MPSARQWVRIILANTLLLSGFFGTLACAQQTAQQPTVKSYEAVVMTNQEFDEWIQQKKHLKHISQTLETMQPVSMQGKDTGDTIAASIWYYPYPLSTGDSIAVLIEGQPELSREDARVNTIGSIFLPLIGEYKVSGKDIHALPGEITEKYKEYLVDPKVDVVLTKSRPQNVYILGSVGQPGPHAQAARTLAISNKNLALDNSNTTEYRLSSALANAGGVKFDADLHHIKIYNDKLGYYREADMVSLVLDGVIDQDVILNPDDVVYVPRLTTVNYDNLTEVKAMNNSALATQGIPIHIYGFVGNADSYMAKPDEMYLQTILAKAGGPSKEADPKRAFIIRTKPDGTLDKQIVDATTSNMALLPNDMIVFAKRNKVERFQRFFNMLISPVSALVWLKAGLASGS